MGMWKACADDDRWAWGVCARGGDDARVALVFVAESAVWRVFSPAIGAITNLTPISAYPLNRVSSGQHRTWPSACLTSTCLLAFKPPILVSRHVLGIVRNASRFATQRRSSPSRFPNDTSCGIPRIVVVISATRILDRYENDGVRPISSTGLRPTGSGKLAHQTSN